jgi:excisionase family DNA binding protein
MKPRTTSIPKAARRLGICDASAYRAAQKGELPVIRIGRRYLVLCDLFEQMLAGQWRPVVQRGDGGSRPTPDPQGSQA